jgi:integrase
MEIESVTNEKWNSINKSNREIVEEFLKQSSNLSDYTLRQYESGLKIFFIWIADNKENKNFWEIKPRDFLHYQNWLIERGLSSSAIRFKRSAVSTLNNYITVYYSDEYPTFHNYVNKSISLPPHNLIKEKLPLTLEEYGLLCKNLEKKELWQQLAYLKFSFSSGARRNEVRQLTKDMLKIAPKKVKTTNGKEVPVYYTGKIRCKGRGKIGKIRVLQYDQSAFDAIKKWLSVRGNDDIDYVFAVKDNRGILKQVGESTFNQWCTEIFSEMIGRRFHPHLIRESRATTMVVEQKKDIEIAQKLLGHESSETTTLYVIRNDEDDSDEAFI